MTPERWKQIEEVFQTALDLPPVERRRYIVEACTGDDTLREQVEALVAQHDQAGDFIEEPAFAVTGLRSSIERDAPTLISDSMEDPAIGRRVGPYKIVREIGRGGMGAVYMAEREDGEFRRRVAIKLIKRGMDTDFILRRFRNERQILASLDHPYIARLLDGGTTEDGLPYFVMEYIEGLPIYRFCDERNLGITERLRLFRQVCDAVHYAHRHLVIHRDIKPGNILVTAEGVPKLLDFGIAKLLNPELADITIDPTATAMRLMTPEYASPEQVQGMAVTPTTDVYSLGVLLYELLTGHRPYRFLNRAPHEIARVICEEKPMHPSVVISRPYDLLPMHIEGQEGDTLKFLYRSRGGGSGDTLRRDLEGDVDNIVMKALRKETERRYQSVEQLRDDITRHLDGQPVSAPPFFPVAAHPVVGFDAPTAEKSIAVLPFKILDERRAEETGDLYLGLGLADVIITRLSQLRRFNVRPTSSVLRYGALDTDPVMAGRKLEVGFVLDGRIQRAGENIRVTVQLLDVWSGGSVWAGQFDEKFKDVLTLEDAITSQVAEAIVPHLSGGERSLLAKRSTDSPEAHEAYMRGRYHWNTLTEDGFAKALIYFNQAVALAPDYALAYTGIADYYNFLGVYAVLPFSETSAAAREAALKSVALDDTLAEGFAALGFATLMNEFDWEASERHLRRAIELNPNYVTGRLWYSYFLGMEGRFDEALAQVRRALELDPLTPLVHHNLSWIYYNARRYEESMAAARNLAANEPNYGLGQVTLCMILWHAGEYDRAIAAGERAVELLGRSPYTLLWLAAAHASAGHREEAHDLLDEVQEMEARRYVSPYLRAMVYSNLGDGEGALSNLEEAWEIRDARLAWLGVDPQFDQLRGQPRFNEILRRTNNPLAARITHPPEPATGQKSVAVLPMRLIGPSATGDEYLGVGLADALITRLSSVRRFVVRPTSSVLRYQGGADDPLKAGRELNVDFIVTGTIRSAGKSIRVSAQLLSVADGATRWAGHFDASFTDVLHLEDSISEQVATALVTHLSGDERRRLSKRGTDNAEAFEAYLRGRYHWTSLTEDSFARAISCYYRAIALDPDYAAAYAAISEYHSWLAIFGVMPPAECLAAARDAARRAVELDDTLAEAHTALGFALLAHPTQWEEAKLHHLRAIELNPNYPTAYVWYAGQLAMEGRFTESDREIQRACELDPLNPLNAYNRVWYLYQGRRYDESIRRARDLIRSDPRYGPAYFALSWALRRIGDYDGAIEASRKSLEFGGQPPLNLAAFGSALAEAGQIEEARRVLAELHELADKRFVTPYHRALVHLNLGERDAALSLLEQSVDDGEPWIVWLGVEPQFDVLRGEERFTELLRRTRNPAYLQDVSTIRTNAAPRSAPPNPRPAQTSAPASAEAPSAQPRPTDDEEAHQLYVAGRYFATRRTAEGLRQAIERLEKAVERDPSFAVAYAEMADCYALLNWYIEPPPADAWERAKEAALDAVRANERVADGHASLGFVLMHSDRDFRGAAREFRRATELKPDNAVAHRWHAFNLSAMGRHDEAVAEIRRAQEINPRSPVVATAFANVLFFAQRYREAIDQCNRALELDPGSLSARIILRWAYEASGMCTEAFATYEQERAFAGDTPTTRAKHAHVLAACGRSAEARETLRRLVAGRDKEWVTAYEIAVIYSFLGERDEAFNWLDRAAQERAVGLTYVRVDPRVNNLRADPRFNELLRRLNGTTGGS
ncbi:MAG TPA: protein kinase [Pyrinomonadaceae bacterium]|jgi:serine/threonine protein kinase/tetratricopeptide (TPR) repeat protein